MEFPEGAHMKPPREFHTPGGLLFQSTINDKSRPCVRRGRNGASLLEKMAKLPEDVSWAFLY
jgi:hypothetical protein